ncbi:MAG: hypothetical protein Q8S00_23150 [Deltaproteobacteria bacterium]|nr:hypothetical protein [Deltaproteobacteria bacterium]
MSSRDNKSPISAKIYLLLWFVSALGAVLSFITLQKNDLLGLDTFAAIVFGVASFFQQAAVYKDLHGLDQDPQSVADEYRNWLNERRERVVRGLIMFTLLFGVGKIADAFFPVLQHPIVQRLFDWIRTEAPAFVSWLTDIWTFLGLNEASKRFGLVCTFLFFFLLTWNIGALRGRLRPTPLRKNPSISDPLRYYALEIIINLQIVVFMVLTIISLIYWFLVFQGLTDGISGYAVLTIGLYALLVVALYAVKTKWSRERSVVCLKKILQKGVRLEQGLRSRTRRK